MFIKEKLIPVGILEPVTGRTFLAFGNSNQTSDLIADVIEKWLQANQERLAAQGISELVINSDNAPDCNSHRSQFLLRMTQLADKYALNIHLAYYPPYHSKYNPVERVWSVLENEWNGDLLDTIPAALGHAQSMTWNGNHPVVQFVDKLYESGKKLGAAAMRALEKRLQRLPGLEKWFVDVVPTPSPA